MTIHLTFIRGIQNNTVLASLAAAAALGCAAELGDLSGPDESVSQQTAALTQAQREAKINDKAAANQPLVGNPTSAFLNLGDGASRDYSGGNGNLSIYVGDAVDRAHIVMGLIRGAYHENNGKWGVLGYPTTDEHTNGFGTGKYNLFEFGRVLWKIGAPAAFEVSRVRDQQYARLGLEWGSLGFPTSHVTQLGPKQKNNFEFGRIYSEANQTAWPVLTSNNPNSKLAQMNAPRITSAWIRDQNPAGKGCITASGAGFTPGQTVQVGHSNSTMVGFGNKTAVVAANGTFSILDSCATGIRTHNGTATVIVALTSDNLVRAATPIGFGNGFPDPLP